MDVTMESAPGDKIRLFRAMFRGREDVYARRYVSAKSGKSGCSPRLYHDYICVVFTIRHGGMW